MLGTRECPNPTNPFFPLHCQQMRFLRASESYIQRFLRFVGHGMQVVAMGPPINRPTTTQHSFKILENAWCEILRSDTHSLRRPPIHYGSFMPVSLNGSRSIICARLSLVFRRSTTYLFVLIGSEIWTSEAVS